MTTQKMKAILCTQYGSPEVLQLQEIAKPSPKKKEVLIKVHASIVTAADGMMRRGIPRLGRLFIGLTKPKNPITGTGFAGEIVDIGEEVTLFKKGERVFGESVFAAGTNAEYLCVPEDSVLTTIPAHKDYAEVAPVSDGPLTSWNLLKNIAKIQSGQRVLINGASGSLGTAAVQLAKHFGAEVRGVCSTSNLAMVKSLGADHVIDYTTTDFTKAGKNYDIIYDTVGKLSFSKCKRSLTKKGIYLSPVLGLSLLFQIIKTSIIGGKRAKFDATGFRPIPALREMLQELRALIAADKLQTIVDRYYPLEQTVEAHRYVDQGHKKGNVIIRC